MERFKGKAVIVTGAGSGIGAATARRFAQEGATVVLAGRTESKLKEVARALAAERTLVQVTDVSRYEEAERLVAATVARFGRVDVLVNNAGIAVEGSITEPPLEDFERVLSTNLGGVFHCSRAAMAALAESRGSIVNTSSVSGLAADWSLAFYNASKGAISNLTRAMALDSGRFGVRVNAVCPGLTRTPMTEDIQSNRELLGRCLERIPLGRAGEPEDVAGVIAFLASDDARFVSGVNLPVDGGLMASNGQADMA